MIWEEYLSDQAFEGEFPIISLEELLLKPGSEHQASEQFKSESSSQASLFWLAAYARVEFEASIPECVQGEVSLEKLDKA